MRNAFARAMTELAQEREDVCLLSGDIGNRMFDRYKEVAPTRFMNCGIAEANMMSMAAGMGLSGLRPVVYTITPFTTIRCLEQIRTGVAYHESPVVIVGTGSGLSYAELGATHHSLEDMAVLRSVPNMRVCAPADSLELVAQLRQAVREGKPTYIRIGKKGEPVIHNEINSLGIGKAKTLRKGQKIMIMTVGPFVSEAIEAANKLEKGGLNVGVATMGSTKPLDNEFLRETINLGYTQWITVEEHHRCGGLGSAVIEWLNDNDAKNIEVKRIGIDDMFIHELGNQGYVRERYKIDWKAIKQTIEGL